MSHSDWSRSMKMKSGKAGKPTSVVEIRRISTEGFWILIADTEKFVAFEHFPWFKNATVSQLLNVVLPSKNHLYWPDLDADVTLESIDHPERFPLVSRVGLVEH